jgi:hypothetical protein
MSLLPTDKFTNMIHSDPRTFIRLSLGLLEQDHRRDTIQFLLDHSGLFESCLDLIAAESTV